MSSKSAGGVRPASTAAGDRFNAYRIANLVCDFDRFFSILNQAFSDVPPKPPTDTAASRHQLESRFRHCFPCFRLVAHSSQVFCCRPDEGDLMGFADFGKLCVLG